EMIDTTGGTIKVLYDDGGSVTYPMRPSMISNFDGELADIQKVSVSLYGFSATFNVAVMSNVIPGDVDGDEQITSTDARLTLQFYAGKVSEEDLTVEAADVDGDGTITSTDARLILQLYAGKIEDFPI
ncbi:MAG: dockerin type I repeat-containing protein, partial [Clostridia bacterium]|nr:dockerin type I repeat-containing protein [Clostridia bacterium]